MFPGFSGSRRPHTSGRKRSSSRFRPFSIRSFLTSSRSFFLAAVSANRQGLSESVPVKDSFSPFPEFSVYHRHLHHKQGRQYPSPPNDDSAPPLPFLQKAPLPQPCKHVEVACPIRQVVTGRLSGCKWTTLHMSQPRGSASSLPEKPRNLCIRKKGCTTNRNNPFYSVRSASTIMQQGSQRAKAQQAIFLSGPSLLFGEAREKKTHAATVAPHPKFFCIRTKQHQVLHISVGD